VASAGSASMLDCGFAVVFMTQACVGLAPGTIGMNPDWTLIRWPSDPGLAG